MDSAPWSHADIPHPLSAPDCAALVSVLYCSDEEAGRRKGPTALGDSIHLIVPGLALELFL